MPLLVGMHTYTISKHIAFQMGHIFTKVNVLTDPSHCLHFARKILLTAGLKLSPDRTNRTTTALLQS